MTTFIEFEKVWMFDRFMKYCIYVSVNTFNKLIYEITGNYEH